jgi:5-methylcytosine-specific restriction enzyme A
MHMKRPGSFGKRWTGEKLQRWRKRILSAEPLCRHCAQKGKVTEAEEVDHIRSLEDGGTYEDSNAQPLCKPCHKVKTAKDRGYRQRQEIGADGWPVGEGG